MSRVTKASILAVCGEFASMSLVEPTIQFRGEAGFEKDEIRVSSGTRHLRLGVICSILIAILIGTNPAGRISLANESTQSTTIAAGTVTQGGLVSGARLHRVTSLADSGPGTLREAVESEGPRIIVFDVAGTIHLDDELRISNPHLTIAGQTAPTPGILLRGNKVRVSGHDIVIQHIAVRPDWSEDVPNNADAISIGQCQQCEQPPHNVLLENVSVSWAVDENIGLWGEGLSGVTIRSSLIAEALNSAGHAKGAHSMGVLIGTGVQGVEVVGNLFVSNANRNPVVGPGASAFVANNFIHNPGRFAIHLYSGPGTRATMVGNVVKRGANTRSKIAWLDWEDPLEINLPDAQLLAFDNHCCDGIVAGVGSPPYLDIDYVPVVSRSWFVMPAGEVREWTLKHSGSRPAMRHPIDERIVAGILDDSGRIIDDPDSVGGFLESEPQKAAAPLPDGPFELVPGTPNTRIAAWLCLRHLEVGGAPSPQCRESADELRRMLAVGN